MNLPLILPHCCCISLHNPPFFHKWRCPRIDDSSKPVQKTLILNSDSCTVSFLWGFLPYLIHTWLHSVPCPGFCSGHLPRRLYTLNWSETLRRRPVFLWWSPLHSHKTSSHTSHSYKDKERKTLEPTVQLQTVWGT